MTPHTPHPSPGTVAAAAAVDDLQGTLQVARALAQGGRTIDLDGLDAQAARLCLAISLLPGPEARVFRAPLLGLIRDVDALRAALPDPGGAQDRPDPAA